MRAEPFDLFICHVTADDAPVNQLAARIEAETLDGTNSARFFRALYDHRDVQAGTIWRPWLLDGVRDARFMVVLVCPEILESEFTSEEIATRFSARPDVIPLWVRDLPVEATAALAGMPRFFKSFHCLDFRNEIAVERNFPKLLDRLRGTPTDRPSYLGTNESKVEVELRSLAEAFEDVRKVLCFAFEDSAALQPIAVAWVETHPFLVLPICRVHSTRGFHDHIFVRSAGADFSRLAVGAKRLLIGDSSAGCLTYKAPPKGRLPPPAIIAPPPAGLETGAVFLVPSLIGSDQGALGFTTVEIRDWSLPDGVVFPCPASLPEDTAFDGMPLFDRQARLVGILQMTAERRWQATPLYPAAGDLI